MLLCQVQVLEMISMVSQTVILKVTFAPSQRIILLLLFGYLCGISMLSVMSRIQGSMEYP